MSGTTTVKKIRKITEQELDLQPLSNSVISLLLSLLTYSITQLIVVLYCRDATVLLFVIPVHKSIKMLHLCYVKIMKRVISNGREL